MWKFRLLGLLSFVAMPLSSGPDASGALGPEQWHADVAFLARELPKRHKNAFACLAKTDFDKQARALMAGIPNLSDGDIRAGIVRLVYSLRDAHTSIWGYGSDNAIHVLPIRLSRFKDGIFVTGAAAAYRGLLAGKLERIGGMNVEEAGRALSPFVAHDNDACLNVNLPAALLTAELLHAARVSESVDRVWVQVQSPAGEKVSATVQPLTFAGQPPTEPAYAGELPLFQRNTKAAYWASLIDNGGTVYFQYNRCAEDPELPFGVFCARLRDLMSRNSVRRLVLDLRNNGGGANAILSPWVKEIRSSRLNRKGRFFVLIGPRTFSSAVDHATQLRDRTAAMLVGEPTCGKPNCYGDVRLMELPNSRMKIAYSTKYFRLRPVDEPWLMPDIVVERTSKDYFAGVDPVLDAVLR